jgi:hypothetical protein
MMPLGRGINVGGAGPGNTGTAPTTPTPTATQSGLALVASALAADANANADNIETLQRYSHYAIFDIQSRHIRNLRRTVSQERSAKRKAIQDMSVGWLTVDAP